MNAIPPDTAGSDGDLAGWPAVSATFAALGRVLLCLDTHFTIVHASPVLDDLMGEGVAREVLGRPIEDLMGSDPLGPEGAMRLALRAGERREGWRASLGLAGVLMGQVIRRVRAMAEDYAVRAKIRS